MIYNKELISCERAGCAGGDAYYFVHYCYCCLCFSTLKEFSSSKSCLCWRSWSCCTHGGWWHRHGCPLSFPRTGCCWVCWLGCCRRTCLACCRHPLSVGRGRLQMRRGDERWCHGGCPRLPGMSPQTGYLPRRTPRRGSGCAIDRRHLGPLPAA